VQGACSRTCTGFSDCPNTPPGNAVRYCSDSKVCLAYGCATQQDCAPGLKCYLSSGGGSFCTSCASGTAGGTCL
jgi:hypothetical protein